MKTVAITLRCGLKLGRVLRVSGHLYELSAKKDDKIAPEFVSSQKQYASMFRL